MPRDASDLITTTILCLLALIGWIGFSNDLDRRLEKEMNYHEEVWERSRESNRLMGCFRQSYGELYLIDDVLMTGKAEKSFASCL